MINNFSINPQIIPSILINSIPLDDTKSFWEHIKNDLLRDQSWDKLRLRGIGTVEREKLEKLVNEDFLVHPKELMYAGNLTTETIRQAKEDGLTTLHLAAREGSLDWAEVAINLHPVDALCRNNKTALSYAAAASSKSIVHLLLINGADPQYHNESVLSPLEQAAAAGDLESIKLLISKGAIDHDNQALRKAIQNKHDSVVAYLTELIWKVNLNSESTMPPIHTAILKDRIDIVRFLLENGEEVDHLYKEDTPLIQAAGYNKPAIVQLLIEYGANVNSRDKDGWSSLHFAAALGYENVVRILLRSKQINLNIEASDQTTPLHKACTKGFSNIVRLLVNHGADINIADKINWTPLMEASSRGFVNIVSFLLERKDIDLTRVSNRGNTPLHIAATADNEELIHLLSQKFNPNTKNLDGETALAKAVDEQNESIVRALLACQADPTIGDINNWTPLHHCASKGNLPLLKILLETNCNVNLPDNKNQTPLTYALKNSKECSLLLIEHGANNEITSDDGTPLIEALIAGFDDIFILLWNLDQNRNQATSKGQTLLHLAAKTGNYKIAEFLISNGFDVNQQNAIGSTPLNLAIDCDNYAVAELLLNNGADPNLADEDGVTALHKSMLSNNTDIKFIKSIIEKSENSLNLPTKLGNTPLHLAVRYGFNSIVELLIEKHAGKEFDINKKNYRGKTPLYEAIANGNKAAAEILLKNGADPNIRDDTGWSALNLACLYEENADLIEMMFLSKDITPVVQTNDGNTPLHIASICGNSNIAELLLKHKFDPNVRNKNGETPAICAVIKNQPDILRSLIAAGADINILESNEYSALHIAAMHNHLECVKSLVENGALDPNILALRIAIKYKNWEVVSYLTGLIFNINFEYNGDLPPLLSAAKLGHENVLIFLLQLGMDPNLTTVSGKSAMHYAAEKGLLLCMQHLVAAGGDPNLKEEDGWTPLHYAVSHQQENIVKYLIEIGCDVNEANDKRSTLLHLAARKGNENIMRFLIEKGGDLNKKNKNGQLPLHSAASHGHANLVDIILEINPNQVNAVDNDGSSALHFAASNDNEEVTRLLLEFGADQTMINKKGTSVYHFACRKGVTATLDLLTPQANLTLKDNEGLLPIHYAVQSNNEDLVKHLLQHNDIEAIENKGITPLIMASMHGKLNIVNLLLDHHANVHHRYNAGYPALHLAALNGREDVFKELIVRGADANIDDSINHKLLHLAAKGGLVNVVKELLDTGNCDINLPIRNGDTALHLATLNGRQEVIQHLIDRKANINAVNNYGVTAAHNAASKGHVEILQILQSNGLNFNSADQNGSTVLHYAASSGQKKAAAFIIAHYPELLDKIDNEDNTPLHIAAMNGHEDIVTLLLRKKAKHDIENKNGLMPIHLAAINGHKKTLARMQKLGIDPNTKNKKKESALHHAAMRGQDAVIQQLIAWKVDVNTLDENNCNAIHYAAKEGNANAIRTLIVHGCDPNFADNTGLSPIHYAIFGGHFEAFQELVKTLGNSLNAVSKIASAPLHSAIGSRQQEMVKILLQENADPNLPNHAGETPLYLAVDRGNINIFHELLEGGAELNKSCKNGLKPVHYAAGIGNISMLEEILSYDNSSLNSLTEKGRSPLHISVLYDQKQSAKFLSEKGAKHFEDHEGTKPSEFAFISHNDEVVELFRDLQPDDYRRHEEYYSRIGLWHIVQPEVNESVLVNLKTDQTEPFRYGGSHAGYFFREVSRNIEAFSADFPEMLNVKKAEMLKAGFSKSGNLFDRYKSGQPIFIQTGFTGHHVVVMIWKDWFCICNRGAESKNNVDFYRFDSNLLTPKIIDKLGNLRIKSTQSFNKVLYEKLPKKLCFTQGELEKAIEKRFIKLPKQNKKTCAYTSTEMSLGPFFVLDSLFEKEMQLDQIKIGMDRYFTWNDFMQTRSLHNTVLHSLNSDYKPDIKLVEESLDLLRTQEMDERNQKLVIDAEKEWREKGNHPPLPLEPIDWLWNGNQTNRNDKVSRKKVKKVFDIINQQSAPGITFNESKIANEVVGGNCTAQALDLANLYSKKRNLLGPDPTIKDYRNCMRSLRKNFQSSNKKRRIIQAAFNTIEVVKGLEEVNYSRNKMQSLANLYGFEINYASNQFVTHKNTLEELKEEMNRMPQGIYLLRVLCPANNDKYEKHGHTMVYVKEKDIGFFYDPNYGEKDLFEKDHAEIIHEALLQNFQSFQVSEAYFYRLQEKEINCLIAG